MAARILSPRTGDPVRVAVGGIVVVSVFHDYAAASDLQCFVDAVDHDASVNVNGIKLHYGPVPCSKGAGTYRNVPIQIKTNGMLDDTQTVDITVMPGATGPVVQRVNPAPPAEKAAPGTGPLVYLLGGTLDPRAAYVVCAVHELTANPADPPVPVDGAFSLPLFARTWLALVTVPNRAGRAYIARIMEFDAYDAVVNMQTEVLD